MPFPFYRVTAAWMRAFARPILNYAKKYHQSKYDDINETFKDILVFFGNSTIIQEDHHRSFRTFSIGDSITWTQPSWQEDSTNK